jgi:replication-associated recombination protein RarA
MLPEKIQTWLDKDIFPQRALFSGTNENFPLACQAAAQLQGQPIEKIQSGIDPDTLIFSDTGKSFKIDYSAAAKRDGQSQYENVRGLIRWAHQKPIGKARVVVLENFERISAQAPHALLKLLEEPPPKTYFCFTTQNHHALLDTILSRLTVIRLEPKTGELQVSESAQAFCQPKTPLLQKFKIIDELDKTYKKDRQRRIFTGFLSQCLTQVRKEKALQPHLETIFKTYQAINRNQNPKFSLEYCALQLTSM